MVRVVCADRTVCFGRTACPNQGSEIRIVCVGRVVSTGRIACSISVGGWCERAKTVEVCGVLCEGGCRDSVQKKCVKMCKSR